MEHSCTTGTHTEPRLTCYIHHRCRCGGCRALNTARRREAYRAARVVSGRDVYVSSLGVSRRLQALAVIGWSPAVLGERMGLTVTTVSDYRSRATPQVRLSTHKRIDALYRELQFTPADGLGASRVRKNAQRNGYKSPMYWEDIDRDALPKSPTKS